MSRSDTSLKFNDQPHEHDENAKDTSPGRMTVQRQHCRQQSGDHQARPDEIGEQLQEVQ
jgi:hypothetical protein